MKPTHIVYNPEGKPDGLYYIPEMPERPKTCKELNKACTKTKGKCIEGECGLQEHDMGSYRLKIQAAIDSAIKVRDEDEDTVTRLIIHEGMKELEQGKVYELSGLELEVYNKCQHRGIHNSTCIYQQLARIKTKDMEEPINPLSDFYFLLGKKIRYRFVDWESDSFTPWSSCTKKDLEKIIEDLSIDIVQFKPHSKNVN